MDTRIAAEIVGPAEAPVLGFAVSVVWAVVVVEEVAVAVAAVAAAETWRAWKAWKAWVEDSRPQARRASTMNPF